MCLWGGEGGGVTVTSVGGVLTNYTMICLSDYLSNLVVKESN